MTEADEALTQRGDDLVAAVQDALPAWLERNIIGVLSTQAIELADSGRTLIAAATRDATEEVTRRLRDLVHQDVDAQRINPLSILRWAARYPTAVLTELGAQPVERDDFARRAFPDDVYGLAPAAFADLGPAVHEAGLAWGAAKAYCHLRRRAQHG